MESDWIPYSRATNAGPCTCMVNTAQEPDAARPSLTVCHVRFSEPGEHGVGTHEEANSIDDAFEAGQERETSSSVFVARTRGGGKMSFYLYGPVADGPALEQRLRRDFGGRSVGIEHRDDPGWKLFAALLPSSAERQPAQDVRVVQTLQGHGDPLTPKRDVRHFAYFPTEEASRRFAAYVGQQGFSVEARTGPGELPFCIIASRDDSVTLDAITPITTSLCRQAELCGGDYDGWEAALVKPRGLLSRLLGRRG